MSLPLASPSFPDPSGAVGGALGPGASREERLAAVRQLQSAIAGRQGHRIPDRALSVDPEFAEVLEHGALQMGRSYEVHGNVAFSLALAAQATRRGSWAAVIGFPELGAEAVSQLGVNLAQVVFIPRPGPHWLHVASALVGNVDIVIMNPGQDAPKNQKAPAPNGKLSQFNAKLRQANTVLLAHSPWLHAAEVFRVSTRAWEGLGRGHGRLRACEFSVSAQSRTSHRSRSLSVRLDPSHQNSHGTQRSEEWVTQTG